MLVTANWRDCAVPLRLADAALKARAERFLALEFTPCDTFDKDPPAIDVRRGKRGWEFETSFGPRFIDREDDAAFLLLEVLALEFEQRARRPTIHAGAFVSGGGAIVYLAEPCQGKSRLTFAAWCRDYPILGDDRIALLCDEGAVQPIPKCVKLRLDDADVPPEWEARVPDGGAFVGAIRGERRWILSRHLPGVVDCEVAVPVRAVATLRRVAAGSTCLDEVPVSAVLAEALDYTTLAAATPMDLLRLMKAHARRGFIPRLNIAPDEVDEGLALLAAL